MKFFVNVILIGLSMAPYCMDHTVWSIQNHNKLFLVSVTTFDMKQYTSDLKSKNKFGSAMEHYISDLKGPQQNKQGRASCVTSRKCSTLRLITILRPTDIYGHKVKNSNADT